MNSPAVSRKVLRLTAGVVWTAVGLALCIVAVHWLVIAHRHWVVALATGIIIGAFVYRFGFLRLVQKNIARIIEQAPGRNKVCLFSFQSWRSYGIIIIMMGMGYGLRHLAISRIYLVPIYMAIGIGLFLASLHYYAGAQ
jgi:hypothetical protein